MTKQPILIVRCNPRAGSEEPITLDPAPVSLDDATRRLPGGAYTTLRTFGRVQALRLAEHFERLRQTARLAEKPVEIAVPALRAAMRRAVDRYSAEEMRLRLVLDLEAQPGTVYLLVEALHVPPPEAYERGVSAVTRAMQRSNPRAKLTGFITESREVREALPAGVNEAIMVGTDGRVLEGLSSNFFAVRGGVIWTAEAGVLPGITRDVTLGLIQEAGIPLRMEGLPAAELALLEEAFITSASRAILPVTSIEGQPMGDGRPGPITRRLLAMYQARIAESLEPI